MNKILRTLFWVGSSKKDLMKMPADVQDIFGFAFRYTDTVYVLHFFQKKFHQGIETPKHDMELIRSRLKSIEETMRG